MQFIYFVIIFFQKTLWERGVAALSRGSSSLDKSAEVDCQERKNKHFAVYIQGNWQSLQPLCHENEKPSLNSILWSFPCTPRNREATEKFLSVPKFVFFSLKGWSMAFRVSAQTHSQLMLCCSRGLLCRTRTEKHKNTIYFSGKSYSLFVYFS